VTVTGRQASLNFFGRPPGCFFSLDAFGIIYLNIKKMASNNVETQREQGDEIRNPENREPALEIAEFLQFVFPSMAQHSV
jgi:hypothetical protein